MRVVQLIPTITYGDAVGNDAIALKNALKSLGYSTNIYAESVVKPINGRTARKIRWMGKLHKDDIAILHLSTGAKINERFAKLSCRKIIIYHNVTPPHYFAKSDPLIKQINEWALEGVKYLADKADYCLADSEFNKEDLRRMGYTCPIDVLPILIPMEDYDRKPSQKVIDKYKDGRTNIIFTGRIVPNKKQEDVIQAFYYYKRYCDPDARLFIVGSYKKENHYYKKLKKYVDMLHLRDVYFTGHIHFDEILAYYSIADLFLCMSEHEGFCVPLVEAMKFRVPVVAYNSTAIPATLGGSGFLLPDQDPLEAAMVMERIIRDKTLRDAILESQDARLQDFAYDRIREQFAGYLRGFIEKETK